MFRELADEDVPWRGRHLAGGRAVAPDGDPDRNLTGLARPLPAGGGPPADAGDRSRPRGGGRALRRVAARRRSTWCTWGWATTATRPRSCPGDPVLEVTDRDVAVTGEYEGFGG